MAGLQPTETAIIKVSAPVNGIFEFDSVASNLTDSADLSVLIQIRFVKPNGQWSSFYDFNTATLEDLQIGVDSNGFAEIEYQLTGDGILDNGLPDGAIVTSLILTGQIISDISVCIPSFSGSLFEEAFNCSDDIVHLWCSNVLAKILAPGILPTFIERGGTDDKDFRDFWKSITCFFALFYRLGVFVSDLSSNEFYLSNFLRNRSYNLI